MSQSKSRYIERLKQMVKDDSLFHHKSSQNNLETIYDDEIEKEQEMYESNQIIKPEDHKDWWLGEKIQMNVQGENKTYGWFYDVFNDIHFVIFNERDGFYAIEENEVPLKVACEFVQRYRNF